MTARTALPFAALAALSMLLPGCPKLPDGDACVARRETLLAALDAGTIADIDCPAARDAGLACDMTCGSPENCGNELGVGMHCTRGGGECAANGYDGMAFLCILDQRPDEFPVCVKPCRYDDECGSGAFCASESPGSLAGCLPRNCAPDSPGSPRPNPDGGSTIDAGNPSDAGDAPDAGTGDAGLEG